MLLVPKSLIDRWSAFSTRWVDVQAFLHCYLDALPAVAGAKLQLADIAEHGWQSDHARRRCEQACEDVAQHCIEAGRYAHNIAIFQALSGYNDNPLALASTTDLQRHQAVPPRWLFGHKLANWSMWRRRVAISNRYRSLPSWAMLSQRVHADEAVLVTAPLCLESDASGQVRAFLCDYPDLSRSPSDPTLELSMPQETLRNMASDLGPAAGWLPYARVLGIVRDHWDNRRLEVLRLEWRVPAPEARHYDHEPTWSEALIKEAVWMSDQREMTWASEDLGRLSGNALVWSLRLTDTNDSAAHAALSRQLARADDGSHRGLTRRYGTPFDGQDAFWCATVTLLHAWRQDFLLSTGQAQALLTAFDTQYDADWRAQAEDETLADLLRYTSRVMTAVRDRLCDLASPPQLDAEPDPVAPPQPDARSERQAGLSRLRDLL
ncbi:conserved hypothethical protein (plasmid) [Ralstonia solanacearum CMR15]|nr:conserved hypothethical protein [Ralstonia solanacearum CMR15]